MSTSTSILKFMFITPFYTIYLPRLYTISAHQSTTFNT
nr:MAG TPA: hypothetical protein [Bacteriophage sp.]